MPANEQDSHIVDNEGVVLEPPALSAYDLRVNNLQDIALNCSYRVGLFK